MTDLAIWDDNGEWVEIEPADAERLIAAGVLYFCPGDSPTTPACHADDVYHVADPHTLKEVKTQLQANHDCPGVPPCSEPECEFAICDGCRAPNGHCQCDAIYERAHDK